MVASQQDHHPIMNVERNLTWSMLFLARREVLFQEDNTRKECHRPFII